jgi:hypothetical protein
MGFALTRLVSFAPSSTELARRVRYRDDPIDLGHCDRFRENHDVVQSEQIATEGFSV